MKEQVYRNGYFTEHHQIKEIQGTTIDVPEKS